VILLFIGASLVLAQSRETGAIEGKVTDEEVPYRE